jgi:alpha-beta hydrolase superfamily lysophospholipase
MKLVLLPGMDGTGLLFRDFIPYCDCDGTIISLPSDGKQLYPDLAEKIKNELPQKEDYILLAESFSSGLIPHLMSIVSHKPKAVILVSGFLYTPKPFLIRCLRILPLQWMMKFPGAQALIKYLCIKGASENTWNLCWSVLNKMNFLLVKQRLEAVQKVDHLNYKLDLPVLILTAKQDKLVASHCLFRAIHLLPNVHVRSFDGPHFLLQEKPQQAAKLIMDFMSYIRKSST